MTGAYRAYQVGSRRAITVIYLSFIEHLSNSAFSSRTKHLHHPSVKAPWC